MLSYAWSGDGAYYIASTMPVTTCTMKTASVALPSVCAHVRLPGILRSSNCSLMPRRSTRSSSQRKIGFMISCLDARGHAQPIFLVLHVDGAVTDLYLELVQRTGRRSVEHGAGLEVESPVVAGTCLLYTSPSPRDRQKSRMPS